MPTSHCHRFLIALISCRAWLQAGHAVHGRSQSADDEFPVAHAPPVSDPI